MSKVLIMLSCLLYTVVVPKVSYSQHWGAVGNGFSGAPVRMYVDDSINTLYALGNFTHTGSQPVQGAARYMGMEWDTMPVLNDKDVHRNLFRFKSTLVFGYNTILTWNGVQLDTIGVAAGGDVYGFTDYNGELLAYGSFDSISGTSASMIAKWNGNTWSAIDTTRWNGIAITDAIAYQGELYAGGGMWNNDFSIDRLARWNGLKWNSVGNGITGSMAGFRCFEIYNAELYVGGGFSISQGNPGNAIARWNGSQWSEVGAGMTSLNAGVTDLQVYDNELYACGQYYSIGDFPITGIAKWDGAKWCGLGQVGQPNYSVNAMAVYNNELFVAGPFLTMDGDTVNYVAKWIGGSYVGVCEEVSDVIDEVNGHYTIFIYPNPTTNQLIIESQELEIAEVNIYNATGSLMMAVHLNTKYYLLNTEALAPGIYIAEIKTQQGSVRKRWVKM